MVMSPVREGKWSGAGHHKQQRDMDTTEDTVEPHRQTRATSRLAKEVGNSLSIVTALYKK